MYPFEHSGLTFGSIYLHEPGALLTNFFIFVLGLVLVFRMDSKGGPWLRCWRAFLLCIALAAFGGLFTHGFPLLFTENEFYVVWWLKNSLVALGNYFASIALLAYLPQNGQRPLPEILNRVLILKVIIVSMALYLTRSFIPAVVDLAMTYGIAMYLLAKVRYKLPGTALLFSAFALALASGLLYLVPFHLHRQWLTHKDVIHLFMLASMWLVFKGAGTMNFHTRQNN